MGRVKAKRVNSNRARTRDRAFGTHVFTPAEPNWRPRRDLGAIKEALAGIGAKVKAGADRG